MKMSDNGDAPSNNHASGQDRTPFPEIAGLARQRRMAPPKLQKYFHLAKKVDDS